MNSLERRQTQDKVTDSTLVDDKSGLHDFPVRPVCRQNQKPVVFVEKLSSEY